MRDPFKKWGSAASVPGWRSNRSPYRWTTARALPNYLALARSSKRRREDARREHHARPIALTATSWATTTPRVFDARSKVSKYNDAIFAGLVPLGRGRSFVLAGDWNTARRQATARDSRRDEFFTRVSEARWHDCTWSELETRSDWFGNGKVKQDDYVSATLRLGDGLVMRQWQRMQSPNCISGTMRPWSLTSIRCRAGGALSQALHGSLDRAQTLFSCFPALVTPQTKRRCCLYGRGRSPRGPVIRIEGV